MNLPGFFAISGSVENWYGRFRSREITNHFLVRQAVRAGGVGSAKGGCSANFCNTCPSGTQCCEVPVDCSWWSCDVECKCLASCPVIEHPGVQQVLI